ncbi:serine carboxypeptidase [Grosmannia clavigera kw1407]|uniref:Carboxypeptidase n=1 Tax=Grosmannia clavigera (strain kw1407 / UAMH 11150) TaxID=655863 RepID=F0XE90_GROCL|nr:serine carboxypeptidase [Grosmannia clavigera kw1407]EFX04019.1 serine carboxypeptidase [Grosmannia clavigera kw1407]
MRWQQNSILQPLLLAASLVSVTSAAGRSLRHVGKSDAILNSFHNRAPYASELDERLEQRTTSKDFLFLNNKTSSYAVDGTAIPDVSFDVGESYAGSLPLSSNASDPNQLFWWFFPSENEDAKKEIVIWLNGGPGCSSLEGLLQENGPFIWQYGTYLPVQNTWSWNKLSNIVYIEQPVGTGFSVGTPTATSEEDVARQFLGFWKNFAQLFSLQGYKVYIAGESYAGMYCPYIAAAMVDANDTTYYNLNGVMIYDPVIGYNDIQNTIVATPFVDYWPGLFPFNDSFVADIHNRSDSCGYSDYLSKYLVYPPSGQQPTILPGQDSTGTTYDDCENIYNDIIGAALLVNPCWDIYQVATTCPLLWDVLGFPGTLGYLPDGAQLYFDRDDVKKAIHAPNMTWAECTDVNVFVDGTDTSVPSGLSVLPKVIDATKNVIIGHGALDFVLIANGTLLTIQNMTWGGKLGFQSPPTEPLFVPYHDDPVEASMAGSGILGTAHTERGLTYAAVDLSGHMIPQYAPSVAYRQLEFLLGRVSSLSSTEPFTTDANVTQPTGDLGNGNAPQGYATVNKKNGTSCSISTRTSSAASAIVTSEATARSLPLAASLSAGLALLVTLMI